MISPRAEGKKAIVISGVPGSGKTRTALSLSAILGALYVNLSAFSVASCFLESYDESRDTYLIREESLVNLLDSVISCSKVPVVIDSHYGELVPDKYVMLVIVLRIHPSELLRRLRDVRKWWAPRKIAENVAAELMGACTSSAIAVYGRKKVCEVNVTGLSTAEIISKIIDIIEGNTPCKANIDWLNHPISIDVMQFITKYS